MQPDLITSFLQFDQLGSPCGLFVIVYSLAFGPELASLFYRLTTRCFSSSHRCRFGLNTYIQVVSYIVDCFNLVEQLRPLPYFEAIRIYAMFGSRKQGQKQSSFQLEFTNHFFQPLHAKPPNTELQLNQKNCSKSLLPAPHRDRPFDVAPATNRN